MALAFDAKFVNSEIQAKGGEASALNDIMERIHTENLIDQYGLHDVRMQTYENKVLPNAVRVAGANVAAWDAAVSPGMQGIILHRNGSMYIRDGASIHRHMYVDGALRRLATYTHESTAWSSMLIIGNALYFLAEGANVQRTQLVALDINTLEVLRRSGDLDTGTIVSAHTSINWGFGTSKLYFANSSSSTILLLMSIDLVTFERITNTMLVLTGSTTVFLGILGGNLVHILRNITTVNMHTTFYDPETLAVVRARHATGYFGPSGADNQPTSFGPILQHGGRNNATLFLRATGPGGFDTLNRTTLNAAGTAIVNVQEGGSSASLIGRTPQGRVAGFVWGTSGAAAHVHINRTGPSQVISGSGTTMVPRDYNNHNNVYVVYNNAAQVMHVATTAPQTSTARNDHRIRILYDAVTERFYPTYYLRPDTLNLVVVAGNAGHTAPADLRMNPVMMQELTLGSGDATGINNSSQLQRALAFPPYTALFVHGGRMYAQQGANILVIPRFDDPPPHAAQTAAMPMSEAFVFDDGHVVYDKALLKSSDKYVTCKELPTTGSRGEHDQMRYCADMTTGEIRVEKVLAIPRENTHCGCIWACECPEPAAVVGEEKGAAFDVE